MKILWKIYAVLYVLFVVAASISDFTNATLKVPDYIDVALALPSLVAVVGWAWRKAVGTQIVWLSYAALYLSYDILYNLFWDSHPVSATSPLLNVIVGIVLLFPAYVALLLYAVNFNAIKSKKNNSKQAGLSPSVQPNPTASMPIESTSPTLVRLAEPWNQPSEAASDPQLIEIQQQQAFSSAQQSAAQSMVQAVQESYDDKIEAEQLGKWPWDRWYSNPVMGRDPEKGISDIIFLSLFGSSSATDKKRSRGQRAVIRVILTLVIVAILSQLKQYLLKP